MHGSGIVAVVTAAVVIVIFRNRLQLHGSQLLDFWDLAGFLLNAVVFLLIGIALPTSSVFSAGGAVVACFITVLIVRCISVYLLTAISDWKGRLIRWPLRPILVWGGMRGALSIALALSLVGRIEIDPRVTIIGYGVVVLSLILQGATVGYLVRGLVRQKR